MNGLVILSAPKDLSPSRHLDQFDVHHTGNANGPFCYPIKVKSPGFRTFASVPVA